MAGTNGKTEDRLARIPLGKIRHNAVALRPVNRDTVKYQEFARSVKKDGVVTPILVREFENPENKGEMLYGIIDGLQRFTAAADAGYSEIDAKITDKDQAEVEEMQMILNVQKIETRPNEYAEQIKRLLQRKPTMTMQELSDRLSMSTDWIYKILRMNSKLIEDIRPMVDEKKIGLGNAIELSNLPPEEQPDWLDKAMTMDVAEFKENVARRMKTIKEARRTGRKEGPAVFEPVAHQRKWNEIKAEYEGGCPNIVGLLKRHGVNTPEDAAKFAIAWVAQMDPDSQDAQRQRDAADRAKKEEEANRKKLERTQQKEEEAQKTRAELEAKLANKLPPVTV